MKVIDLLNKIVNGENVPKKIKIDKEEYIWDSLEYFYSDILGNDLLELSSKYNEPTLLNMDIEIIEEIDIDIQSIQHNELDILQEILGKCDLWKGNEGYILKVINENNNRLVDAILKVSKENETLTNAIKQLDRQINNN